MQREGGGRCPERPRNPFRVTGTNRRAQFLPKLEKSEVWGQVDGNTPSSITSPGPGDSSARAAARAQHPPPSLPLTLTQALTSASAPCSGPALRVILVEVGEQQLAGAGLSALARQVHGCTRATGSDPLRGSTRGATRAARRGALNSGSAPAPVRGPARLLSLRGDQPPPHPVPTLVYAPEPGRAARLRRPAHSRYARRRTAQVRCVGPASSPQAPAGFPVDCACVKVPWRARLRVAGSGRVLAVSERRVASLVPGRCALFACL